MSLQVWLPLTDGTLKQQGLNGATIEEVTSAVFDNSGKLGKCLSGGKIKIPANQVASIFNNTSMSIAFWYNNNTLETTGNHSICGFSGNTEGDTDAVRIWDFFNYANPNTFHWSMGTLGGGSLSNIFPANTWVHVCVTWNAPTLKIYMDGVLKYTGSGSSNYTFNKSYYISFGRTPQKLNDFRIYDHCLSPMEVKELAKGLILHYPLSDPSNDEKENLMPSNYWSGTKTISLSANTTNYGVINYPAISVETDTTYFWTVNFRIISGGNNLTSIGVDTNCSGGSYSGNDSAHTVITTVHPNLTQIKAGKWQTAYCITKVKADATNPTIFHTIYGCSSTATTLTVEWRNLMLVESTEVVPFRGQHSNIIYDCSGFCNNGAIVGTLTISNDTPKYQVSTHIGSTSSKIHISNFPTSGFGNTYSFAWWGKNTTFNNKMFWGFSDGIRLNGMYGGVLWNTGDSSNNPLYKINTTTQVSAPSVNTWHHYVMVGNGTKCYVYLDGELWAEAKTYKAISGTSIYINGWGNTTDYCYDNMDMSDFRIYATALSADDVKSLYQNSAYIDSSGNVYGKIHD